jgi:hypothetical protein
MRGVANDVSPSTGFRFVCYCKDCQAFARFLERTDVLDPAGGTDIFQLPPGRVKLTAGTDAMQCLSLSNKVLRWYADCCRTPVANTAAGPHFPVIGLVHSFMDHEADSRSRDEVLGPPLCRIHERSALGPLPPNAPGRPRRSSTMGQRLHALYRACSRREGAPPFDRSVTDWSVLHRSPPRPAPTAARGT